MPFAFWHVACEGCAAWRQIEHPRFWRMLFAHQRSPGPLQASLQRHPQTLLSWPRRMVPLGDASSSYISYLLSWGAKKGGKDWCKVTQTAYLEDIVLGGVIKCLQCGGTGMCASQGWYNLAQKAVLHGCCPMVAAPWSLLRWLSLEGLWWRAGAELHRF